MKDILIPKEIEKIEELLGSYPQITAGYLFGSRIKSKNTPISDLDLGVVCYSKADISPVEIAAKLQSIISRFTLDVVVVDLTDDPFLLIQVINGRLIHQKNLVQRIKLETRILHLYEDNKILRNIAKYYLDKSFKEGVYAH